MSQYVIIRIILIVGIALIGWAMMRPSRTASHLALRRLAMFLLMLVAVLAILFPDLLNGAARLVGVDRGINLLVYLLVLAFLAQLVTSHRRDVDNIRLITAVARAQALANPIFPNRDPHDTALPPEPDRKEHE